MYSTVLCLVQYVFSKVLDFPVPGTTWKDQNYTYSYSRLVPRCKFASQGKTEPSLIFQALVVGCLAHGPVLAQVVRDILYVKEDW